VRILVVNAGSTSLKLHLVVDGEAHEVERLEDVEPGEADAVAHRVVHGGARFREPVRVDAAVRKELEELVAVAPLHNRPALAGMDAVTAALPGLPQVAVFDTAFHATIPAHASTYALPRRWREELGIRRYGFHGLSVEWSAERAAQLLGHAGRLVVCHLGGGSSVTAVAGGCSLDTTMGFTPLEGVPMTTRSGSIDPGALLHALDAHGISAADADHALNEQAGLAGLCGLASMREIVPAAHGGDPDAALALEVYVHRVAQAVAAMAVAAGGLDALVFTAGIGEGSAAVRELVGARLRPFGVAIDAARNVAAGPDADVAPDGSAVRVLVVRAREELVAARAAAALLATA
jgi:acetate kinase